MKTPLVVDSNILLSALLRDAWTRRLIVETDERLLAPNVITEEVERNVPAIVPRSDLERERVWKFVETLFEYLELVDHSTYEPLLDQAQSALGSSPGTDAVFLATAIAEDGALWSDDTDFATQTLVPVYSTTDIIELHNDRT